MSQPTVGEHAHTHPWEPFFGVQPPFTPAAGAKADANVSSNDCAIMVRKNDLKEMEISKYRILVVMSRAEALTLYRCGLRVVALMPASAQRKAAYNIRSIFELRR